MIPTEVSCGDQPMPAGRVRKSKTSLAEKKETPSLYIRGKRFRNPSAILRIFVNRSVYWICATASSSVYDIV